jgi:hypothetical protein
MARKPTDTVQIKVRIREATRQRIEREAKRRRVPVNGEMAHRLEQSFDQDALRDLDAAAGSITVSCARLEELLTRHLLREDYVRAVDALLDSVDKLDKAMRRVEGESFDVATVEAALEQVFKSAGKTIGVRKSLGALMAQGEMIR